ncbi:MAG: FAD-dependent oxidoreductase [Sedimentisphaerales bacterium]|nr:FAD-dependent oxidoreductase [Sedimentisphaerales bacterium]
MKARLNIGILGGGLSAIALGGQLAHDFEILEKEERPGGLCRSFQKEGFRYDLGGHILFSKDESVMEFVRDALGDNANRCRRNNKIFFKGRYVKYPFENGLGDLEKEDIYKCLAGFLKNEHKRPRNFKEWIYYTFGDGIAEAYLIPYNRKIWKCPLEKMAMEWVERIPRPPVEDIIKSAIGIETEGYLHQLYFHYPARGGIEALVKALIADGKPVTTGFEVTGIRRKRGEWIVSNGCEEKMFEKIVVTMPVLKALECMDDVPGDVLRAARSLVHNRVRVVMVGVNNTSLLDKSAIYFPSPEVVFHRACFMGYFSVSNVPSGQSSLIAEVTANGRDEVGEICDSGLVERVIDDLARLGVIDEKDVVTTDVTNIEYGYVVYDSNYAANVRIVRGYASSLGIELLGRFGEFEYLNMDEVIRRSHRLAEKLNAADAG